MFENPKRGKQARNFITNVSKILDLKSSSEQIFFRKLSLGALSIYMHYTAVMLWPLHEAGKPYTFYFSGEQVW